MTKIYCAIDTPDLKLATNLAYQVSGAGCGIKLGLEFFATNGPDGVAAILKACPDSKIFLDMKYHDIPNTVAGALRGAARLGVAYINCHASGGMEMMKIGLDALLDESLKLGVPPPRFLAVTVLTSIDQQALISVGQTGTPPEQVIKLAKLTRDSGLAGIVCSGQEIRLVRESLGDDFVLMVPGIRPVGTDSGDQKRIMSPQDAILAGATHLVIGRPITGANDPAQAASDILETLK
ncbi:MAG: orotidine-5'-phosphate decarboxylase [Alphaproteobacteria bacterium]|nr:orotidine-5'-phosphate decarboxylase [Alphaproteobacteria bacterium]